MFPSMLASLVEGQGLLIPHMFLTGSSTSGSSWRLSLAFLTRSPGDLAILLCLGRALESAVTARWRWWRLAAACSASALKQLGGGVMRGGAPEDPEPGEEREEGELELTSLAGDLPDRRLRGT